MKAVTETRPSIAPGTGHRPSSGYVDFCEVKILVFPVLASEPARMDQ